MVKKSLFKRSIVLLVVMMMVLSYANPLQFTYAESGDDVVETKICTVEEHEAHGDAQDGYEFSCTHNPRVYDYNNTLCSITAHGHSEYAGGCYYQNDCEITEHVHINDCYEQSVCDIPLNHQHTDACYDKCSEKEHEHSINSCRWFIVWLCGKADHKHSTSSCQPLKCTEIENHFEHIIGECIQLRDLKCGEEEHTHASAQESDCQGWTLTCETSEHQHTDPCYAFTEEYFVCSAVRTGSGVEQGNKKITVTVTVLDARDNSPIPGATVNLDLRKYGDNSDTFTPTTGSNGVATVKVDGSYDLVMRYSVDANGYKNTKSGEIKDSIGIVFITSERHYTIKLIPNDYEVKFYDADGEVISKQSVNYKSKATLPDNPTKDNATFIKWDTNAWMSVTNNLDIKPIFESVKHKVTFNLNGGNIDGNINDIEQEVIHGNTVDALTNPPILQNKIFNGWYFDKDATEIFDFTTGITSDITLFANYLENGRANLYVLKPGQIRPNEATGDQKDYSSSNYIKVGSAKFTKSFKQLEFAETVDTLAVENLLSDITTNSVVNNGLITTEFNGYVWTANFDTIDWYVVKTKYNPGNIDGEAVWAKGEAVNYKIKYILNAENATNDDDNVNVFTVNDEIILKDAQRPDYKFEGWYTKPDFEESSKVTGFAKGTNEDKIVYAKWSLKTYTVSIEYKYADGVDGDVKDLPEIVLDTYNIGSNYKYDIKKILGFTASNETIEGTDIRSNQEYVVIYSEDTQEATVNFYIGSNTTTPIATEKVTLLVSELDNKNIEDLIIERIGGIDSHRPEGYEVGQKTYFAEDNYMEIVYTLTSKYNVIYDVNGGKEIVVDANTYTEGENITISSTTVTRDGFEFKGWLSSENNNVYQANVEIVMGNRDITLTAQWEAKQIVDPEKPDPEDPEKPDPEQTEDEEPILDIEDEEIPGGEIPNNSENNSDVELTDEEVTGETVPENNEDENIDLTDEEIPGGAAELPNTAGLTAEILYGLGALALLSGIGFKRKNK